MARRLSRSALVSTSPPAAKMTTAKAAIAVAIAFVTDFLSAIFDWLIFTGPLLAAEAAKIYADTAGYPTWLSGFVFYVVGGGAAAIEIIQPEIAAMVEALGALMAIIIGIAGTLLLGFWFFGACRINPMTRGKLFWFLVGGGGSMIPFVNMFFPKTIAAARIIYLQRREDQQALKEWRAAEAERTQAEERQSRVAEAQQVAEYVRAAKQQTANDNEAARELAQAA